MTLRDGPKVPSGQKQSSSKKPKNQGHLPKRWQPRNMYRETLSPKGDFNTIRCIDFQDGTWETYPAPLSLLIRTAPGRCPEPPRHCRQPSPLVQGHLCEAGERDASRTRLQSSELEDARPLTCHSKSRWAVRALQL